MHRRLLTAAFLLLLGMLVGGSFYFPKQHFSQLPTRPLRYPSAEDLAPFVQRKQLVALPDDLKELDPSIQEAWLELASAEYFIFQPLATHNQPTTPHLTSFQLLYKLEDAGDLFISLYEEGSEEGKLYALCALVLLEHGDRQKIQAELETRNPDVVVFTLQGLKIFDADRIINNSNYVSDYPRYAVFLDESFFSGFIGVYEINNGLLPGLLVDYITNWQDTTLESLYSAEKAWYWDYRPDAVGLGVDLLTGEDRSSIDGRTGEFYTKPYDLVFDDFDYDFILPGGMFDNELKTSAVKGEAADNGAVDQLSEE